MGGPVTHFLFSQAEASCQSLAPIAGEMSAQASTFAASAQSAQNCADTSSNNGQQGNANTTNASDPATTGFANITATQTGAITSGTTPSSVDSVSSASIESGLPTGQANAQTGQGIFIGGSVATTNNYGSALATPAAAALGANQNETELEAGAAAGGITPLGEFVFDFNMPAYTRRTVRFSVSQPAMHAARIGTVTLGAEFHLT
jgi:hypothetical protein